MSAWQVWLVVGIVLSIAEMMVPGFFLLSMGIGCLVASVSSIFVGAVSGQVLFFAMGSLTAFVLFRPFGKKMQGKPQPFNAEAYIGREAKVIEDIDALHGGRVFLGGESWKAKSQSGQVLAAGTKVVVRDRQGLVLVVEESVNQDRPA